MSIKVMTLVWDRYEGSGSDLLTMLALADWCNDAGGSLYPSVGGLAKKIRVSESQARRILHRLIDDGYLSVIGNANGGAPGTTRQYRMNIDRLLQSPEVATYIQGERVAAAKAKTGSTDARGSADASGGQGIDSYAVTDGAAARGSTDARGGTGARGGAHAQDGSHPCAQTGGTHASLSVNTTTNEPSVIRMKGYTDEFERAWKQYPKRAGGNPKLDAFKAWNARIKDGVAVQDMLDGLERYAHFIRQTGRLQTEYVMQGSTFFGPSMRFTEDWAVPVAAAGANTHRNLPAAGSYGHTGGDKLNMEGEDLAGII